jgi:hypothetical protein
MEIPFRCIRRNKHGSENRPWAHINTGKLVFSLALRFTYWKPTYQNYLTQLWIGTNFFGHTTTQVQVSVIPLKTANAGRLCSETVFTHARYPHQTGTGIDIYYMEAFLFHCQRRVGTPHFRNDPLLSPRLSKQWSVVPPDRPNEHLVSTRLSDEDASKIHHPFVMSFVVVVVLVD